MAKTKIDTTAWLKDLGFTEDEIKELEPKFASRSDKLSEMQMRQSDYDRQSNTLKSEYEALNEKLNADLAEFASLTAGEQAEATKLRDRIEASETKALQLTQKINRYADTHGIDPKELLGDVEPPKPKEKEPVAVDLQPLRDQIGGVASYMLRLNAKLPGIMREHKALTGEELDVDAFIDGIQKDIAAGKTDNIDPVKRWEAANQIPTKRVEAQQKATAERDKQIRAEERANVLSEQALPGQQRPGEHAPVFRVAGESKLQRPQPSNRLSGARTAIATGRYRTKTGTEA